MRFIKDEEFVRGNCPMTKEEVRILSICKLELEQNFRVLDIGAGTGSVSIQMSKICSSGEVVAIEKDAEALDTLYKNKEKFRAENITIVEGECLEVLERVEGLFDAIFIGGSGGNLGDIIINYGRKLKSSGRMVLNFITIENLYKAINTLKSLGYETDCTQISISRAKGNSMMLMANNPIFMVSASLKGEEK